VPIVVLSSRSDETGKVKALDLGADDYVTTARAMLVIWLSVGQRWTASSSVAPAGAFAAGRHCASIWIGQRDLPIWRGLNGDLHLSQVLHLLLRDRKTIIESEFSTYGS
jgi:hypothetical protein